MAIAVSFDERVSTFGNMHVVTGSFTISGTSSAEVLDLSDHLSTVYSITVNGSDNTQMHAWLTDVGDASRCGNRCNCVFLTHWVSITVNQYSVTY